MTEISSPYKNIVQFAKIKLLPHQLNTNIKNNMEIVLKSKLEKKCNKFGYIDNINKIISYNDGYLNPENLLGAVSYDVSFECKICIPIENTNIIAKIKAINQELIMAENGPIIIFIPRSNVNTQNWEISNNFLHIKKNKELKIDDYVKVQVEKKKINQDDIKIKCIGKLNDFAIDIEINKLFGNDISKENEDNFII